MNNPTTAKLALVVCGFLACAVVDALAADAVKSAETELSELRAQVSVLRRENSELAERLSKSLRTLEMTEKAYDAIAPGSRAKLATMQARLCIANLKQLDGATQQWALENKKTDPDVPVISGVLKYLKGERMPDCPRGGIYSLGKTVAKEPTCSCPGHTL